MPQNQEMLVLSSDLHAYRLTSILKEPALLAKLKHQQPMIGAPFAATDLPLVPDGQPRPGVLYESSLNPDLRYYLPAYELRLDRGQHTSSLKWRAPDEVTGPLAWLTVELVAAPPTDTRFELREIEHEATVRLGYQLPIEEAGAESAPAIGPSGGPGGFIDFVGEWVNVDRQTRGMTRLVITMQGGGATLHGFGKCHPHDCDWGEVGARLVGGTLEGVYRFSFKQTIITVRRSGEQLLAHVVNDYTDTDGRADRTDNYVLERANRPPETTKPTLWEELGVLERVAPMVRRCRVPIHDLEHYDRLFSVMTDPAFNARLEIRLRALVGERSWRQTLVGNKAVLFAQRWRARGGPPAQLVDLIPTGGETGPAAARSRGGPSDRAPFAAPVMHPVLLKPVLTPDLFEPTAPIATPAAPVAPAPPVLTPVAAPIVTEAPVAFTITPPLAHMPIDAPIFHIPLPAQVVVDPEGRPVLTQREVTSEQAIEPFWFDLERHGAMFDVPEDSATHHILLRSDISLDGRTVTFYQDSTRREQVFYEPQEFLLPRVGPAPFRPDLLFVFTDVRPDEAEGGDIDYRVNLAYRVRPHIDPRFLSKARLEFGQEVRFTALAPTESLLRLRLPLDDDALVLAPRPGADISFDDGIIDEIELTRGQFERVFAAFQSPVGVGFEGAVAATLFDGSDVEIPVRVSLRENTGELFERELRAGDERGTYLVELTNRNESPVVIRTLAPVPIGDGAVALPTATPLPLGVAPGETVSIGYRVTPGDRPLLDLEPILSASVEVDYAGVWSQIAVNEGYTRDTFEVQVAVPPAFFGTPPAGMDALTGVLVEFDSLASTRLTPEAPTTAVSLRMPLLPYLMNAPEARHYRYRLTNLHAGGPGAATDWLDGEGDLTIADLPRGG